MDAARETRLRLLEAEIAHLRAEHEALKRRYADDVYCASWHMGWPLRWIERGLRRRAPGAESVAPAAVPALEDGAPPAAAALAARLLARAGRG